MKLATSSFILSLIIFINRNIDLKKPKISIITTVKNGGAFIIETLQSINAQTFKNFEHIIVDDGSTDNTIDVINQFKKTNPLYNLKLFQPGNLGRGKALNFAVSKASSDWVAIIDADDMWHPKKLELQWKCISLNDIDLLATGFELFAKKDQLNFDLKNKNYEMFILKISDLLKSNKILHSSVLIRKEFCMYDELRKSQFDYELWMRLITKKNRIGLMYSKLSYHRIHKNQSFEGSNKSTYRITSFKLNAHYCIKFFRFDILLLKSMKLIMVLLIPRKWIHNY